MRRINNYKTLAPLANIIWIFVSITISYFFLYYISSNSKWQFSIQKLTKYSSFYKPLIINIPSKYNIDGWGYHQFRQTTSRIASKAPLYLRNWKEVVGWNGNFWNYVRGIGNNKSLLGRARQSRPSIISEGTWGQGRERDVKAHSWSQDARPHEWDTYRRIVQRLKLSSEERKFIMS